MPYIPDISRKRIDDAIIGLELSAGEMAYLFTMVVLRFTEGKQNYAAYAEALGVLETTKLELYRRLVASYEDRKMEENGDVFPK